MLQAISLQNYRSYNNASFEFGSGVNIIVGPNGSGKTNLLEAIEMVLSGSSYRSSDDDLVRFEASWMRVDARLEGYSALAHSVKYEPTKRPAKSFVIDDKRYLRLQPKNIIPVVLFEPNHLLLLHGSPDVRRNYLDSILEVVKPEYGKTRKDYKRVLGHRNALLKRDRVTMVELFPWNLRLSELGEIIAKARSGLIEDFSSQLDGLYKNISHSQVDIEVKYLSKYSLEGYSSQLMTKLEQSLDKERTVGYTLYGPHREDFEVYYNGKPVREVASRGETRTIILGLKILELELLEKTFGLPPILLLDDVFSELDGARRRALTNYLEKHQSFLTTTDADIVIQHFTDSTIIPLNLGI